MGAASKCCNFTLPFIVSKYVTHYTFWKAWRWLYATNEHRCYKHALSQLSELFIYYSTISFSHFVLCQFTSGRIISSFCINISANCMTALVNHVIIQNDVAGFFEVNISKLPSRFPPASTVCTAIGKESNPVMKKSSK